MYVNNPQYPPLPPQGGYDYGRKRKMALWGTLAGVGLCIALFAGLSATGVLKLRSLNPLANNLNAHGATSSSSLLSPSSTDGNNVLEARNSEGSGLLSAHDASGSSTLMSQPISDSPTLEARSAESQTSLSAPTSKTGMPADVKDWLEHLRITEQKREALATQQVSQCMSMIGTAAGGNLGSVAGLMDDEDASNVSGNRPSAQQAIASDESMRQEWVKLLAFFNSKTPPSECVSLRNQYDKVLRETGNMILDIIEAVESAGTNLQGALGKLQGMVGKSRARIDVPAQQVDEGVKALCDKYDTRKWFDIKQDFGGGSMSQLGF